MLQIKNISKTYITGDLEQVALKNVSLNLRDNEFIAILGPSGSGKTTLLNIIGGLDRYDSGDMVINGISTKAYKEKDWNAYRNHTVGFVFQSYNLIPHQSILANVELALTISGVSSKERRERAKEALKKVGLYEQMHKRPNQMSGGQMQRVAIARALVNNPDILLADEPTGALDSETSIQVMDLLKEVARDRLVVMVTHNPELASSYANRIVQLKDGEIIDDTNQYLNDNEEAIHKNMGRSSMSFLTALNLSFNNLWTKRARTILVSLAGSIGIIGIALILSLSNGVNNYIKSIEEETLSEYPLQIQSTGFNFGFMAEGEEPKEGEYEVKETQMINTMFSRLNSNDLKSLKTYFESEGSDIKKYVRDIEYSYEATPHIYRVDKDGYRQINPDNTFASIGFGSSTSSNNSYISSFMNTDIFYSLPASKKLYENQYDIKAGHWPEKDNELVLVLTSSGKVSDFMLYAIGFKDSKDLDKMVNQFAQDETVVSYRGEASEYKYEDFIGVSFKLLHSCDYYEYDKEYKIYVDKSNDKKHMEKLLKEAKDLVIVGVVQPKEDAKVAMLNIGINYPYTLQEKNIEYANESEVVKAQTKDNKIDILTGKAFGDNKEYELGMDSLFSVDEKKVTEAFSFDTSAINIDPSSFNIAPNIDMSSMNLSAPSIDGIDLNSIVSDLDIKVDEKELGKTVADISDGYSKFLNENYGEAIEKIQNLGTDYLNSKEAQEKITSYYESFINNSTTSINSEELESIFNNISTNLQNYLLASGASTQEELIEATRTYLASEEVGEMFSEELNKIVANSINTEIDEEKTREMMSSLAKDYQAYIQDNYADELKAIRESFNEYISKEDTQKKLNESVNRVVNVDEIESQLTTIMNNTTQNITSSFQSQITMAMENIINQISYSMQSSMTNMMNDLPNQIQNAFRFDVDKFSEAITMSKSEKEIQEIMMQMMSNETSTYDSNLRKLGYANLAKPSSISIYPLDFNAKEEVLSILDSYNEKMKEEDEEKVISYTDTVGVLMSGVTDIIDAISYVLVAFVAISLIVSSIMIGVITYISVLERRKEIGILRSIGASKRNISEVFNAETFIIGLFAGLFGVTISWLLLIPINHIIHKLTDIYTINAYLPIHSALILVALSVILTLIGGIIPSRKAAKVDPVQALRSE